MLFRNAVVATMAGEQRYGFRNRARHPAAGEQHHGDPAADGVDHSEHTDEEHAAWLAETGAWPRPWDPTTMRSAPCLSA